MTSEQREQVAAQLEAVAKRLRAGEGVGGLSASWVVMGVDGDISSRQSIWSADYAAGSEIPEANEDGLWPDEMHQIGWGLAVWVRRAQAVNVRPNVCAECESREPERSTCTDCVGTGEGLGDYKWECDYELAPILANAVVAQYGDRPSVIEADGGES